MWNISQAFKAQLRNPNHQIAARATLLNSKFQAIPDGDFFTPGADDFQDYIVDGNVDIDRDRGTRRTGSITIRNPDGAFTPDGDASDYEGKFYVNRVIRLYRGVVTGSTTLYAPIGTFMVDSVDILVERNMSVVNMTLSDLWKKMTKSVFVRTKTYPIGTHVNTIIRDFAAQSGADYPLAPALDTLTGSWRNTSNTTLTRKLTFERGDNRGEKLKELGRRFGIDIYFNVEGRLTTNDRKDPKDAAEVWHFFSSNDPTQYGMLNSVRRTISDDNFWNHVFVIGLGDEKNPVIYEAKNTDPTSLGSIDLIGDRVKLVENQVWKSQAVVDEAGKKLYSQRYGLFEETVIDVVCNPALEADDVIRITEPMSKLRGLYRIVQFNVPLTTSKQTIRTVKNYTWSAS